MSQTEGLERSNATKMFFVGREGEIAEEFPKEHRSSVDAAAGYELFAAIIMLSKRSKLPRVDSCPFYEKNKHPRFSRL